MLGAWVSSSAGVPLGTVGRPGWEAALAVNSQPGGPHLLDPREEREGRERGISGRAGATSEVE